MTHPKDMPETVPIPLSQGKHALIDAADVDLVGRFNWAIGGCSRRTVYARSTTKPRIAMHRLLMNPPKGSYVDHINGNGLDNRRGNLRICSMSQNLANRPKDANNTSGYKGVNKSGKRWFAQINCAAGYFYLGTFATPEAAARAYDTKALELFGEFVHLNFPVEDQDAA